MTKGVVIEPLINAGMTAMGRKKSSDLTASHRLSRGGWGQLVLNKICVGHERETLKQVEAEARRAEAIVADRSNRFLQAEKTYEAVLPGARDAHEYPKLWGLRVDYAADSAVRTTDAG